MSNTLFAQEAELNELEQWAGNQVDFYPSLLNEMPDITAREVSHLVEIRYRESLGDTTTSADHEISFPYPTKSPISYFLL